jgi:cystathionine beta-synthase
VSDRDAFANARRLTRDEGILAGESSDTALAAALAVARELTEQRTGPRAVMVVILPDTGRNYLSKLHNDEWMREHDLRSTPDRAHVDQ